MKKAYLIILFFLFFIKTTNIYPWFIDGFEISEDIHIKLIKVKKGCFEMGCYNNKKLCDNIPGWNSFTTDCFMNEEFEKKNNCKLDEMPLHKICLDTYYISQYPITFKEYDYFCDETGRTKPDDEGWGKGSRPVINVSWNDAKAFAEWYGNKIGMKCRLPTEAEWEYACKSGLKNFNYGTKTGKIDHNLANYKSTHTSPVGSFPSNDLGLFDMSGNVWEWCEDTYDKFAYKKHKLNNPIIVDKKSTLHVLRGGSWKDSKESLRCTNRYFKDATYKDNNIGFRIICK